MRILPTLLASSVFADNHCTTEDAVIYVDCLDDFSVNLRINDECINQFYPDIDATDFVISPVGTTDDTAENTCYPSTDSDDSAKRYFYSDEDRTAAIGTESLEIYFIASQCGLTPTIEEIDGEDKLIFKTYLCTKIPAEVAETGVIFTRQMDDLEIKCIYSNTLPEFQLSLNPALDAAAIEVDGQTVDIIDNAEEPIEISSNQVAFVTVPDVSNLATTVALGDEMVVMFTKIGQLSYFHIDNCKADNSLDKDDADYASVLMIENGCLKDNTAEPLVTINPQLSEDGKTFTFNQFGFVVANSDPIVLSFNMLCTLKFGDAPTASDCSSEGGRRSNNQRQFRQESPPSDGSAAVLLDYGVTAGDGDFTVDNGIAVAAASRYPTNEPGKMANQFADSSDEGENNGARSIQIGFLLAAALNVL